MSRYVELSNGTLMEVRRSIEGVPFFSDWLEALLLRRAAFRSGDKIIPYDGQQEQACELMEDGTVRIICIGCAGLIEPLRTGSQALPYAIKQGAKALRGKAQSSLSHYRAQLGLANIKIGGLIQMAIEEPCNNRVGQQTVSFVRRWQRRSVSKEGMGCSTCQGLYQDEVALVDADNRNRASYLECLRGLYIERGDLKAAAAVVPAKEYTAWLDVLTGSVATRQFTEAQARAVGA